MYKEIYGANPTHTIQLYFKIGYNILTINKRGGLLCSVLII